jgi:major histocompatibility complex class I
VAGKKIPRVGKYPSSKRAEVDFEVLRRGSWERSGLGAHTGSRAVVAHAFNPSTWKAEAGGFLSSRPAWATK